jgi:hypothetical protein
MRGTHERIEKVSASGGGFLMRDAMGDNRKNERHARKNREEEERDR